MRTHPRRRGAGSRRGATVGTILLATALASTALAPSAAAQDCYGDLPGDFPDPEPAQRVLRFGIFPGGPAGVIAGPRPPAVPEDQARIDSALHELRGAGHFGVHLYTEFTAHAAQWEAVRDARALAGHYTARGFRVEYVIRYRPANPPNVIGYLKFVRSMVRKLGPNPKVTGIQVTNEVNNAVSPDASDGAYQGATRALVRGVMAAKREARRLGHDQLRIGFNWFYRMPPDTESDFWTAVRTQGGTHFPRLLDWVGLDAYPGTFFPPTVPPPGLLGDAGDAMVNALGTLRCFADETGIPDEVPIRVTENGWPTSPTRPYAMQEATLREMINAVYAYRRNFNVTDYRWFDLRDSNSSQPDFQQQYGLMRDDYTPKPAFGAYKELVAEFGTR